MFWRRGAVGWIATPRLWSIEEIGATPVDFFEQLGILSAVRRARGDLCRPINPPAARTPALRAYGRPVGAASRNVKLSVPSRCDLSHKVENTAQNRKEPVRLGSCVTRFWNCVARFPSCLTPLRNPIGRLGNCAARLGNRLTPLGNRVTQFRNRLARLENGVARFGNGLAPLGNGPSRFWDGRDRWVSCHHEIRHLAPARFRPGADARRSGSGG